MSLVMADPFKPTLVDIPDIHRYDISCDLFFICVRFQNNIKDGSDILNRNIRNGIEKIEDCFSSRLISREVYKKGAEFTIRNQFPIILGKIKVPFGIEVDSQFGFLYKISDHFP